MANPNGNGRTMWIVGILVVIGTSVCGVLYASIDTHEKLKGHPVLIERVDGMSRKLDAIETTQHEQSGMLRKILTEVEKG